MSLQFDLLEDLLGLCGFCCVTVVVDILAVDVMHAAHCYLQQL